MAVLASILHLPVDPRLKKLVSKEADEAGMTMNEWVAMVLAEHLGRDDLASIPRMPVGRPRKIPAP